MAARPGPVEKPPALTVLATLAFSALMVLWTFLTPLTRGPDEVAHIDLVFHLAAGNPYPEYDERSIGTQTFQLLLTHGTLALNDVADGHRTPESALAFPLTYRYDADDDADAAWLDNQMPQHPPLYYETASWVLQGSRLLPGERGFADEVQIVRLHGVAMMSVLPVLAWLTARRLRASRPVAAVASLVPLLSPQITHIGGSVNNDNLLVPLMALTAWVLAPVLHGDLTVSRGAKVGAVAGLAALTKGFALVLPMWIAVVYATALWRSATPRRWSNGIAPLLAAAATFLAFGGWYWIRNLVVHGKISPSIHSSFPVTEEFTVRPLYYAGEYVRRMALRFWGEFGYHELPLHTGIVWVLSIAAAAVFVAAMVRRPQRDPDPQAGISRWPLAAWSSLVVLLLAFTLLRSWDLYDATGVIRFVQGRYLFGALVVLALPFAIGATRLLGRHAALALCLVAVALHAEGARVALVGWWGLPDDSLPDAFRALRAWHPTAMPLWWLASAVLVVSLAGLVVVAARHDRPPEPEAVAPASPAT